MRSLPTAIAVLALLGALLALGLSFQRDSAPAANPKAQGSKLEERIMTLEAEVAALRTEITAAELAAGGDRPAIDTAGLEARITALEQAMAAVLASTGGAPAEGVFALGSLDDAPAGAVTEQELERTRRAIAELRREELASKLGGWIDKESARSEKVLAAIEEKLQLPYRDMERVRALFTEETEAHAAIMEELWSRDPPKNRAEEEAIAADWDTASARMKEIRIERDAALETLLGAEQFEVLQVTVKAASRP